MQGLERVSLLVYTMVSLCARILRTAFLENGPVDSVACVHGGNMSGQRFPLRPHSLFLHGAVFLSSTLSPPSGTVLAFYRLDPPAGSGLAL